MAKTLYSIGVGFQFNEGSLTTKWLPTIHINKPKGLYYFSIWYLGIRISHYGRKNSKNTES